MTISDMIRHQKCQTATPPLRKPAPIRHARRQKHQKSDRKPKKSLQKGLTNLQKYDKIERVKRGAPFRSTHTEGYRSGHNEAVLKPPCHSGSNQRKSPVFEGNTRTFRTAKFFLLMFFLIQFHSSVYTEGYRSGHNEAVLKTV